MFKSKIYKGGLLKNKIIGSSVNPGGGTDADAFMKIAEEYYLHSTFSPVDKNSPCQNSYVLVIGDGDWYNHSELCLKLKNLFNSKHKIKTFTVAFGTGIIKQWYKKL